MRKIVLFTLIFVIILSIFSTSANAADDSFNPKQTNEIYAGMIKPELFTRVGPA